MLKVVSVAIFHVNSFFNIRSSGVDVGWGSSLRRKKPFQEILQRFEKGHIEPEQLGAQVNGIFPQVEDFQKDWKDACVVYPSARSLLLQIEELSRLSIPVYIVGNIDPLQKEVIEKECGPLPGTKFLSCEREETGTKLWARALKEIIAKHPNVSTDNIFLYYNSELLAPWYERMGFGGVRKIADPIQKLFDDDRKAVIDWIEKKSQRGRFQAISLDTAKEKNLIPQLVESYHAHPDLNHKTTDQNSKKPWTPAFRKHLTSAISKEFAPYLPMECAEEAAKYGAAEEEALSRERRRAYV